MVNGCQAELEHGANENPEQLDLDAREVDELLAEEVVEEPWDGLLTPENLPEPGPANTRQEQSTEEQEAKLKHSAKELRRQIGWLTAELDSRREGRVPNPKRWKVHVAGEAPEDLWKEESECMRVEDRREKREAMLRIRVYQLPNGKQRETGRGQHGTRKA